MNDNIYELILKNNSKGISYLVDIFQENTINSQKILIDIIDYYRNKLKDLNKNLYSLNFRKINTFSKDWISEFIITIKDSSVFYLNDKDVFFWKEENKKRHIQVLDNIIFEL